MVTTLDIAKRVGVNQSTVSRVLSGFKKVKPETIEKVKKACEELGYIYNAPARTLRTGCAHAIALQFPVKGSSLFTDTFVAEFIQGVSEIFAPKSYSVILSYFDPNDASVDFARIVKTRRADGVILTSPRPGDPRIQTLIDEDIPCILGRYDGQMSSRMACVDYDNKQSAYLGTKFLISRGHRNIVFCKPNLTTFVELDYLEGYKQALQEAGLEFKPECFTHIPMQIEEARPRVTELLQMPDAPTAFLVGVRQTTLTIAQLVHDLKQDITVLGEDSSILQQLFPHLPRIVCSPVILGRQMARALLRMLSREGYSRKLKLLNCFIVDENGKVFKE
jgi:LacI family transcriptional regulator/LacI family purine nucleotide synthesis repressor